MRYIGLAILVLCLVTATPVFGQEIVLELWDGITATDGQGIDALVAQFNAEHAGEIRVNRTATPWGELYPKVTVAVAGGVAPDIWIMHRENIPTQAINGILQPIDKSFEQSELTDEDFLPGLAEGGFYEGHRYGIPMDVHPLLLYYNENHILQAGLPGPPTNSAEHFEWARKLTKRESEDQVRYGTRVEPWGWLSYTVLRQFGASAYGGDGYRDVAINSDEALAALEYMYDLVYTYEVSGPSWILDGNVSMQASGIWWLGEIQRLRKEGTINIKVASADQIFGDKRRAVFAGSHMFTFPRQVTVDPAKMQAAMKFVAWMGDHNVEWARYGQLPARRSAATSAEFQRMEDHMIIAQQVFDFPPPVPWGQSHGPIEQMVNMVLSGEAAPQIALEQGEHLLTVHRDEILSQIEAAQTE